jgi:hypothetical protein
LRGYKNVPEKHERQSLLEIPQVLQTLSQGTHRFEVEMPKNPVSHEAPQELAAVIRKYPLEQAWHCDDAEGPVHKVQATLQPVHSLFAIFE